MDPSLILDRQTRFLWSEEDRTGWIGVQSIGWIDLRGKLLRSLELGRSTQNDLEPNPKRRSRIWNEVEGNLSTDDRHSAYD